MYSIMNEVEQSDYFKDYSTIILFKYGQEKNATKYFLRSGLSYNQKSVYDPHYPHKRLRL